jgi:preprotein translocase subunit YajC
MVRDSLLALIAQAGGAAAQPQTSPLGMFLPLILIGAIMYFLIFLPQKRRQKAHELMLKALVPGDRVVTTGGIVGTVIKADDDSLRLRVAPSVEVTVMRGYVAGKAGEEISS